MPRLFVVLIALTALGGCIVIAETHSDYLTTVRVSGAVSLPDGDADPLVVIEVRDVNLDDAMGPDQRLILRQEVPAGRPFALEKDYFWGSSADDPYLDARIAVSIDATGCEGWNREFGVAQSLNGEYDIVLKVGEIRIDCG